MHCSLRTNSGLPAATDPRTRRGKHVRDPLLRRGASREPLYPAYPIAQPFYLALRMYPSYARPFVRSFAYPFARRPMWEARAR
jgi:hypothetical protein